MDSKSRDAYFSAFCTEQERRGIDETYCHENELPHVLVVGCGKTAHRYLEAIRSAYPHFQYEGARDAITFLAVNEDGDNDAIGEAFDGESLDLLVSIGPGGRTVQKAVEDEVDGRTIYQSVSFPLIPRNT